LREIRDQQRWEERMRRLRDEWLYPQRPVWPDEPIVSPDPWPEYPGDDVYWDWYEIVSVADLVDRCLFEMYLMALGELSNESTFNYRALSAYYDLIEASTLYVESLHKYENINDTVFELLYLEETLLAAEFFATDSRMSHHFQQNYAVVKFYIEKLLWNYQINEYEIP
jgi:hypothetical protein